MGNVVPVQDLRPFAIDAGNMIVTHRITPEYENSLVFAFNHAFTITMQAPTPFYYKKYKLNLVGDILIKRGNDPINLLAWQRESITKQIYNLPLGLPEDFLGGKLYCRYAPSLTRWHHKKRPWLYTVVTNNVAQNDDMHKAMQHYVNNFFFKIEKTGLTNLVLDSYDKATATALNHTNLAIEAAQRTIDAGEHMLRHITAHPFNALRHSMGRKG